MPTTRSILRSGSATFRVMGVGTGPIPTFLRLYLRPVNFWAMPLGIGDDLVEEDPEFWNVP